MWLYGLGATVLEVKSSANEDISSYVKALLQDFSVKNSDTKDVAMFSYSKFFRSKQEVQALFEDIRAVIPDSVLVHLPSPEEVILDQSLPKSSFIILVTDVFNPVRNSI